MTVGSNQTLTPGLISELRLNYSRSRSHSTLFIDNFGGGTPPPDSSTVYRWTTRPRTRASCFFADSAPYGIRWLTGDFADNVTEQINVTENVSLTRARTSSNSARTTAASIHGGVQAAYLDVWLSFSGRMFLRIPCPGRRRRLHAEHAVGDPELELVCPGYMEAGAKADNHVRRAMGVQWRAFFPQRHASVHRNRRRESRGP